MSQSIITLGILAALAIPAFADEKSPKESSTSKERVFEMRTYVTHEGRLPALNKRFREHTTELFKKHGIENIGYWTPTDAKDGKDDTLVYLLAYPSLEAREASWKTFQADPEWHKARDASEKDGKIVKKVISVFLNPTDYSPIK